MSDRQKSGKNNTFKIRMSEEIMTWICSQAVMIVAFYEPRFYTAFYKLLLERQELESLLPETTMETTRGTSR